MTADVAVVGSGLVGLATARALLLRRPGLRLVLLDKEAGPGLHQSGRNSGVLHAGVYYRPGSDKARLCVAGRARMQRYVVDAGLPFRPWGKVIIAVTPDEIPRLDELERRALANGVVARRLDRAGLAAVEPHAAGVAGLHVPITASVDFGAVARHLADEIQALGAEIRYHAEVTGGGERSDAVTIETASGAVTARVVVTCAGLHADRVARALGARPSVALVPFRGEYMELAGPAAGLVRGLIYPVPDPQFPFLGVHLTRTADGRVEAGPSAAPAFSREGYTLGTVQTRDLAEMIASRAFRRFAARHWRMGVGEVARSVSRRQFWRAARRLVPAVALADLVPRPSGVRAQALFPDGTLADDFVIDQTPRAVHVINAPSPAATASLALADVIADRVEARL